MADRHRSEGVAMKKAYIFSILVILALAFMAFTFNFRTKFYEEARANLYAKQVASINVFMNDVQSDLQNAMSLTAYRSFVAAHYYIADSFLSGNPAFLLNITMNISELMIHGTLNKVTLPA